MTTDKKDDNVTGVESLDRLKENLERFERLTKRLTSSLAHKRTVPQALQGPGQDLFVKASAAWMQELMHSPTRLVEAQIAYWGEAVKHFSAAQAQLSQGTFSPTEETGPDDARFSNPLWNTHPYFNFIKQQYLNNAKTLQAMVEGTENLEPADKQRLNYFTGQMIDMMAPTNFFATNPDALERAVETEGQSILDGLENLVNDIEQNQGEAIVSLADKSAFTVGENVGATPGQVVFRNRLIELIQYQPTTETVHEIPLIIFPPWINKFYILDLNAQKSFVKWATDQGFTTFIVSWKNPDTSYANVSLDDYLTDGYLAAIDVAKQICCVSQVNAVGYCIAGTTLSLTLGLLNKRGDNSVKSATFFTTLTDFSDPGEVGPFLYNDFVDGLEEECQKTGILDRFYMARTFSFLRSNDLIYKPAIRNYMMGEAPPAFDLLFWNGDGTNLPGRMAVQYLRGLCQANKLADGGFEICGETVSLADVQAPLMAIACETDHIAEWSASYAGIQKMGSSDKQFVLAGSGHIAGIVNPPSKKKYGHWTHPDLTLNAQEWRAAAKAHEGSWWPHWRAWVAKQSGRMVPARDPRSSKFAPICPAPGTYVLETP